MTEDKKISSDEVEHIAELAKIDLTDKEKEKLSDELSDVLGYIEHLNEVDTSKIEPVSQVTGIINSLREDVADSCDEDVRKKMIENFPEEQDGYIKVKQVM